MSASVELKLSSLSWPRTRLYYGPECAMAETCNNAMRLFAPQPIIVVERTALRHKELLFLKTARIQERMETGIESRPAEPRLLAALGSRSIVLVGMMGAGKTSIGRRLGEKLALPFIDADAEIETAAGKTIPEIFAEHGETYFRDGERRVMARLLCGGQKVLATGGGAFMNAETRRAVCQHGVSIWLKAGYDILLARVKKRGNRPMLKTEDPEGTLKRLIEERYPIYAEADVTVESRDVPHEVIVGEILAKIEAWIAARGDA